jgi:hypothetical protein
VIALDVMAGPGSRCNHQTTARLAVDPAMQVYKTGGRTPITAPAFVEGSPCNMGTPSFAQRVVSPRESSQVYVPGVGARADMPWICWSNRKPVRKEGRFERAGAVDA